MMNDKSLGPHRDIAFINEGRVYVYAHLPGSSWQASIVCLREETASFNN